MVCKVQAKHDIDGFTIHSYLLGPWNHSGTMKYYVTVDSFGTDDLWYVQEIGPKGQSISAKTTQHEPVLVSVLDITTLGETSDHGTLTDRKQLRIYVKNTHTVRVYRGWEDGHQAPRIEPRTSSYYKASDFKYNTFNRDISPNHLAIGDQGYHSWTEYDAGNWTNIK